MGHSTLSQSEPLVVLVTAAGSGPAVSVLRALSGQDRVSVRLVACDAQPVAAGRKFADRFSVVPAAGDGYREAILDLCRAEGVGLLIPASDVEAMALATFAHDLATLGVQLAASPLPTLELCADKWALFERLRNGGFRTPDSALSHGPFEGRWPVVAKPRRGSSGSRGVHIIEGARELELLEASLSTEEYVWQEYIAGQEYTVDLLSDFEGQVVVAVPRARLEVRAGQSYRARIVDDGELVDLATRVGEDLGLVGGGNVQCIRTAAGEVFVIEANARFAAAVGITVTGAGVNTPQLLASLALGERPDPPRRTVEGDVLVVRYWDEYAIAESDL